MKSYIAYKNQIQGIKDVSETVKTVEKIAASSVHFLKQEVSKLNAYATSIEKLLTRSTQFYKKKKNPLLRGSGWNATGGKALVVLTGDKGLVGGLWHKIINMSLKNVSQYQSIIIVGTKGENYLKEENTPVAKSFVKFSDIPQKEEIKHITDYIFNEFTRGVFSQVDILYPKFVSLSEQVPNHITFLPFEFKEEKEKKDAVGIPIFEPSKQKVFDSLLQKYIGASFYKIIMETKLSELSARTVAMEYASTKTAEFIKKFTLEYTKQQRRVITERQLESFTAHKII